MTKLSHMHDRERRAAKRLGMSLQDYLRRKAVLLGRANSFKKGLTKGNGDDINGVIKKVMT